MYCTTTLQCNSDVRLCIVPRLGALYHNVTLVMQFCRESIIRVEAVLIAREQSADIRHRRQHGVKRQTIKSRRCRLVQQNKTHPAWL